MFALCTPVGLDPSRPSLYADVMDTLIEGRRRGVMQGQECTLEWREGLEPRRLGHPGLHLWLSRVLCVLDPCWWTWVRTVCEAVASRAEVVLRAACWCLEVLLGSEEVFFSCC